MFSEQTVVHPELSPARRALGEAILLELGETSDEEAESALAGVGGALDPATERTR